MKNFKFKKLCQVELKEDRVQHEKEDLNLLPWVVRMVRKVLSYKHKLFFFFLFRRGGIIQMATSNENGGESFPGRRIVS